MRQKALALDLVIRSVLKLNPGNGERQNVLAFIISCYCCRVLSYDFDAALAALNKLTAEEQGALITWVVRAHDVALAGGRKSAHD
jgi:hypothetical protein